MARIEDKDRYDPTDYDDHDDIGDKMIAKKWKEFKTEFVELGEDGELPKRMCNHGSIMDPEPHNEEQDSRCCDLCDDGIPIGWDHYYVCYCDGVRTDHCFGHTVV